MWNARVGPEYVADAVARAVRHAGCGGDLCEPRRKLALEARLQVVGARLDCRQVAGEHRHRLQREGIGERMRPDRAPALDRVIHRAHAGREHQFHRRFERRRRIEYCGKGRHPGMGERELDLAFDVGDPCAVAEFGGGQGRRHRRHAHPVGVERRQAWRATLRCQRRERIDVAYSAPQCEQDGLGRIGHRAAADGEQMVRLDLARDLGTGDYGFTRRMGAYRGEPAHAAIAQSRGHVPDQPAVRERVRGEQQHALCTDAFDLFTDGFGRRLAVYHAFLRRPLHGACQHARSFFKKGQCNVSMAECWQCVENLTLTLFSLRCFHVCAGPQGARPSTKTSRFGQISADA